MSAYAPPLCLRPFLFLQFFFAGGGGLTQVVVTLERGTWDRDPAVRNGTTRRGVTSLDLDLSDGELAGGVCLN